MHNSCGGAVKAGVTEKFGVNCFSFVVNTLWECKVVYVCVCVCVSVLGSASVGVCVWLCPNPIQ